MLPPPCRKPLPRAALHSFRAVRALLSKQDGSQATLGHCEKASSCLRESLELGSPPKGTIDKVSWAGEGRGGRQPWREVPPTLAGVHCSCIACVRLGVQCPCHAARRGSRAAAPARSHLLGTPVRLSVPPRAHPALLAPAGGPAPAL